MFRRSASSGFFALVMVAMDLDLTPSHQLNLPYRTRERASAFESLVGFAEAEEPDAPGLPNSKDVSRSVDHMQGPLKYVNVVRCVHQRHVLSIRGGG